MASIACLGQASSNELPNFDIRSLPPNAAGALPQEPAAARAARTQALTERLASETTENGGGIRYSLNAHGRLGTLRGASSALTSPNAGEPRDIALAWLGKRVDLFGLPADALSGARVVSRSSSTGLQFVEIEPSIDALPVFRSRLRIAVDAQGRIIQAQSDAAEPVVAVAPYQDQGPEAAIEAAFAALGVAVDQPARLLDSSSAVWTRYANPESASKPPVVIRRVAFPFWQGLALAAYRIQAIISAGAYDLIVSADRGALLYRVSLRSDYGLARVWTQSPLDGSREFADFGENWLPADGKTTMGNNADAYLDADGDGMRDRDNREGLNGGRAYAPDQVFDFPGGDGFGPPSDFLANSVTHAFFHANAAHDYFYDLGFRESDGNFQTDNFGLGGDGGDAVLVRVQSPSYPDNAVFYSLPEGSAPEMELGIATLADGSFRDLSLSAEVVFHEYAHGVTSRIVGGPDETGCLVDDYQARALGEAWSDYFAASRFDQPAFGRYQTEAPHPGIRRYPFDQSPWRYSDLGNEGLREHNDGEIFTAVLWDIRTVLGAEKTDALVFAALFLAPCEPTFLDARDALLAADSSLNGGENQEALWTAFAARGMGFSSKAGGAPYEPILARFDDATDLPAEFGGDNRPPLVTSEPTSYAEVGTTKYYTIQVSDPEGDDWTLEMLEAPEHAVFEPDLNRVRWRPTFTEGRFVFAVTDSHGNRTLHCFVWLPVSLLNPGVSLRIDGGLGSLGYAFFFVDDFMPMLQFTLREGQGDPDLSVYSPFGGIYDSFNIGPEETISIPYPYPDLWLVVVTGVDEYSGVRLKAAFIDPFDLEPGVELNNLSDVRTGERYFKIQVPEGVERMRVQLRGDAGDADLFVAEGEIPTCLPDATTLCYYDEASYGVGSYEAIELESPAPGDWFIAIQGYEAYSGLTLEASFDSPVGRINAVTDAAAYEHEIAPGGIASLFGENFVDEGVEVYAESTPLPTELAGVQVYVNGFLAPLYYVGPGQINFQVPFEAGFAEARIVVVRDGQVSQPFEATIQLNAPRLFAYFVNEQLEPYVSHLDGSLVTPDNPAKAGELVVAYLTGAGDLTDPPPTGSPAGVDPLTQTVILPTVVVNGVERVAEFSGWTPGLVSLNQVNFFMPDNLPSGGRVSLEIRYGLDATQPLTMAVE